MKMRLFFVVVIFLSIASLLIARQKSLSFGEVVDNLNTGKKTALSVKNYWNEIKGQEVAWSGKVVDVKGGRGKAQLYIANTDRPTYKGFNIVLETFDVDKAGKLDIGQKIKFKGILSDYKSKKGNPVVVYLNQVEFL